MAPSGKASASTLAWPLFVVGSPRSGTSILTSGLLAAGYLGFREGNFLTLLRVFETRISQHITAFSTGNKKVMASVIDWDGFRQDIRAAFRKQVDTLNPVAPWMDKTGNPEMIEVIPQVLSFWPGAKFIFAKRRGIENVISRLKKFPGHSFEYHCQDWSRNMAAWRAMRTLPELPAVEIDQQDILRDPDGVAGLLTNFLGGGTGTCDLLRRVFTAERPQQSDAGSASRVIALKDTGWSGGQIEFFQRHCGPEMKLYNYSLDESYWIRQPKNVLF